VITTDFEFVSSWLSEKTECTLPREGQCIGWTRDGELTYGIMYEGYTRRSVEVTFAAAPGAVMPKEFLFAIFHYAFKVLEVFKMVAKIEETNWRSINMVEKMGFIREARVEDVFPSGAMVIYTLTAEQCRWLENENG
jgi:L-amino acid N-acyltransferase YncA